MTSHTCHPDVHEHGLADDCPRCQELAQDPLVRCDLDLLLRLTLGEPYTETDRIARRRLQERFTHYAQVLGA